MRPVALHPAHYVHAAVALSGPVIRNAGLVEVIEVLLGLRRRRYAVPDSSDHASSHPISHLPEKASTTAAVNASAIFPVESNSGSKMVISIPTASPERRSGLKSSTSSA